MKDIHPQQQQLQNEYHMSVKRRKNNIIKMLMSYTPSNKRLEWKPPSIHERAITITGIEKYP